MDRLQNFINGESLPPASNAYLDNFNPSNGEVYTHVPDSDERDVAIAVQAATAAFPEWAATPARERSRIMLKLAALIEENLDAFALAESVDNGKPLSLAQSMDIPRAVQNFEFFATAIQHFASEAHVMEERAVNYTRRDPVGIVGCISPWNLPLYLFSWKVAPPLAAGNCVIAKPSEITPMTASMLADLTMQAGIPPGVFNLVHGLGPKVGAAIVSHRQIPAITFTGGTRTGAEIARVAAPMFKKLSLELGGKNPTVIFADCDYGDALTTTVRSALLNQGEICLCGSRIYIERPIYEKFRNDLVARVKALRVGDPLDPSTDQGAIVSKQHFDKVLSYIDLAKSEGGTILCGGNAITMTDRCAGGWFIEPTIIEGLPHTCRTNQEEIFGPVVTLQPFDSEEEVLEMANSTAYGLASVLWTRDLSRAHRVSARIKSGIVWVNCWLLRDLRTPFGGTKQSGVGREGGWDALRFCTEAKNVCIRV
jgi:aminomuconate-semialdehyde/2-hydroxymuconate-6-semialdehyde dehydrogenase